MKWQYILLALAVTSASAQQGTPAADPGPTIENAPSVVSSALAQTSANRSFQSCPAKFEDRPEDGIFRIGGSIKPPKPLNTVTANFPDKVRKMAKKQHLYDFHAVSVLSFVLNAQGIPQNICVLKAAGYGLDEEAVKAAGKYRFQPATKEDGTPVASRINLEINFRLY